MTAASSGTEVSDAEVLAQHNDLEMLRRSHLWPHGSLCPMKRRRGDSDPDLIIVVDRGLGDPTILRNPAAHRYFVFEGPMGLAGRQLLASGNDWLLQTLVDSGWVVN